MAANDLYVKCFDAANRKLAECFMGCSQDDCTRNCSREYETSLSNCPCAENCPVGCPCPVETGYCSDYEAKKGFDLLVLSTYDLGNEMGTKLLIDSEGNDKTKSGFRFQYENGATVYGSCAFTHNSDGRITHYVLGGHSNDSRSHTQISRVEGCTLRQSEFPLPFKFSYGACNSFEQQADTYILLCFPSNDGGQSTDQQQCWRWNGDERNDAFQQVTPSKYKHKYTSLASYKGVPLAVGGWHSNTNKVESLQPQGWKEEAYYEYHNELYRYAAVSTEESVIIMGGATRKGDIDDVAEFKNGKWSFLGRLKMRRSEGGAVDFPVDELTSKYILIGGYDLR